MKILNIKTLDAHEFMKNIDISSVQADFVHEITLKIKNCIIKYIRVQKCANGQTAWGTQQTINTTRSISVRHANIVDRFYQGWLYDQMSTYNV